MKWPAALVLLLSWLWCVVVSIVVVDVVDVVVVLCDVLVM